MKIIEATNTRFIQSVENADGTFDHSEILANLDKPNVTLMYREPKYFQWRTSSLTSYVNTELVPELRYRLLVPEDVLMVQASVTFTQTLKENEKLRKLLKEINHSVSQALVPGNDIRRELRLIQRSTEEFK